jgi:Interleukin-like EMT inducer
VQAFGLVQHDCSVRNARLQVAFVELNHVRVWSAYFCGNDRRGIHTMLVDPFSCRTVTDVRQFDVYASPDNAQDLATYLTMLRDGLIVVGVTVDEPSRNIDPALRTLKFLGADVSDVGFRGAFGFVAQKGYPGKTALAKRLVNNGSGLVKMSAIVVGKY